MIATATAEPSADLDRGCHKIFIQQFPLNIPGEPLYKNHCRAFSKSYCKDLLRRIAAGSVQDETAPDHIRTPRGFHRDLFKTFSSSIQGQPFCANLCSRNAQGRFIFLSNEDLEEECHGQDQDKCLARACAVGMNMYV